MGAPFSLTGGAVDVSGKSAQLFRIALRPLPANQLSSGLSSRMDWFSVIA
jgi:hypothetical protein